MHDHIQNQPCDICAFRSRFWTLKDNAERWKDALEEIVDMPHTDTCDSVLSADSLSGEPIYPCTCHVMIARGALREKP